MAPDGFVFAMPDLGEGLEEGEIVAWLVSEGDTVELNQPLVEVETAKATVEIPSPYAGTVTSLHGTVGDQVPVGAPLVTFDGTAGDAATTAGDAAASAGDATTSAGDAAARPARATPPVRKLAKELGVDLSEVAGSGAAGRITADDVRASAQGSSHAAPDVSHVGAASSSRATIAANLSRQAAIPQVTTFRTVDCSALEALRAELGVSPLPVVVAALCRTVAEHPALIAWWRDDGVEARTEVHVGVAADTDRGLVVPVVRDAGTLGIGALAGRDRASRRGGTRGLARARRAHRGHDRREQHRQLRQRGGHPDPVARHEPHARDRGDRAARAGRRRRWSSRGPPAP